MPRVVRRSVGGRSLRAWRRSTVRLRIGRTAGTYRLRIRVPRGRQAVVDAVRLARVV